MNTGERVRRKVHRSHPYCTYRTQCVVVFDGRKCVCIYVYVCIYSFWHVEQQCVVVRGECLGSLIHQNGFVNTLKYCLLRDCLLLWWFLVKLNVYFLHVCYTRTCAHAHTRTPLLISLDTHIYIYTPREKVVPSTHGLLSTVGFKLEGEACVYALEGSIAYAGSTVQWLRDNLEVGVVIPQTNKTECIQKLGFRFKKMQNAKCCVPHFFRRRDRKRSVACKAGRNFVSVWECWLGSKTLCVCVFVVVEC